MAAYEFPVADFSALADIPRVYQAGVQDRLRKSIFEDLTSASTPKDFETAGLRALKAGLEPEANQLFTQAATRRGIEQRGAADELLRAWVLRNPGGIGGTAAASAGAPPINLGTVEYPSPIGAEPAATPAATPAAPAAPVAPVPYLPGARSEAAPVAPVAALSPSLNAPSSPTEQVLAAAERATPPVTRGVQLAGPPPVPDTAPALNPVPPGITGGPTISPAALPPAPPGVPPMGAAPPTRRRIVETPEQALTGRATESAIANSPIATAPPKAANLPYVRLKLEEARNAMRQQNLTPEVQSFHMENIQRSLDGKPPYSYSEYQQFKETTGARYDDLRKASAQYQERAQSGEKLANIVSELNRATSDPNFVPGASNMINDVKKGISNLLDTMRTLGIPVPAGKDVINNDPAALRELVTGLQHQAVVAGFGPGGLSKGVTDPDREYMASSHATLETSRPGIALLNEFWRRVAERDQIAGKIANKYMSDKDFRGNAAELHLAVGDAMDRYNAANGSILTKPNGDPTDLKLRMDKVLRESPSPTGQPSPTGLPSRPITQNDEGITGTDPATGKRYKVIGGRLQEIPKPQEIR